MVTLDNPVKSTGVVMIREIPATCGVGLNFNSLGSPPALFVVTTDQLSEPFSDVLQPIGADMESKVSLKMIDLVCEKIDVEINNANVSKNVFFIILSLQTTDNGQQT